MSASHWTPAGERAKHPTCELDVLARVIVTVDGCWIWTGGTSGAGSYPRILRPGTRNMMAAHRYVFKLLRPHIDLPNDHDLDHLCADWCSQWAGDRRFHRLCVNPDHMQPVTPEENQARKWAAIYARMYEERDAAPLPQWRIEDTLSQELEA